ncbi:MAG: AAA family ATPase, partial [Burkholderiales bacterium]|nr:AAA family ATPase [Burkholderiales bacterium]
PMTMYLEHFGLREAPFRITPHTEFFFAGANRGATLEALVYAITAGEGLVKVTGEVGTGKTMLCRVLMERLPETVETIYLAVPSLTRDEMLIAIASELGIATQGASTTQLLRGLQDRLIALHAEGRQVVALIDEAHAMPLATLEEIRLLSNLETGKEKLLQIVLFGQPELDEHLNLPHMRQLKERITHAFNLAPLPPRDIHDYINFRLRAAGYHGPDLFGPEALRIISDASEGLTRRINIYADKTLLAAFAAGTHTVSPDHARAAVSDTQIVVAPKTSSRAVALAAVAGIAGGIAIGYAGALFLHATPEAPVQAAAAPAQAAPTPAHAAPASVSPQSAAASASLQVPGAAPAPAQAAATPSAASAAPAEKAAAAPQPAASDSRETETLVKGLESRFSAGQALLEATSGPRYVVQLMMTDARDPAYIQAYLAEATRTLRPEDLFLYPSGSSDSPKVGVLYGAF